MPKTTNSLHNYLSDHFARLTHLRIRKSSNPKHDAFYLSIDEEQSKPAIVSKVWRFKKHHMTVEKTVLESVYAMSPLHYTLTLDNIGDARLMCKIHIYMNAQLNFNGLVQKKIIRMQEAGDEVISIEDFDIHSTDLIDVDMSLTISQIKEQAIYGSLQLSQLMLSKARASVEISQQIIHMDRTLAQNMEDMSAIRFETSVREVVITSIKEYMRLVDLQNRYSDVMQNASARFLKSMLTQILLMKDVSEAQVLVAEVGPDDEDDAFEKTPQIVEEKQTFNSRGTIEQLLHEIVELKDKSELDDLILLTGKLEAIYQALLIFDFQQTDVDDIEFSNKIRAVLPPNSFNMACFYYEQALRGNVRIVSKLYNYVDGKIDFIDLFTLLLDKIELNDSPELMDGLIEVAHFFYRESELYRLYVLIKLVSSEYSTQFRVSDQSVKVSALGRLCIMDNIKAFEMYLDQGARIDAHHSRHGQLAFNALQTVLLFHQSSVKPYLKALFARGATLHSPRIVLPDTVFSVVTRSDGKTPNMREVVRYTLHGSKKIARKEKRLSHLTEFEDAHNLRNILQLAWCNFQISNPSVVREVVQHADMSMCFLELLDMISQGYFCVSVIPAFEGGMSFYTSEEAKICAAHESLNRLQTEGISVMALSSSHNKVLISFAENKSLGVYVTLMPEHKDKVGLLKSAQYLYDHFYAQFSTLSDEKKCEFASFHELLNQAQLKDKLTHIITAKFFLGAVIGRSLVCQMKTQHYKELFALLYRYGTTVIKVQPDSEVLHQISANCHVLLDALDPFMQDALKDEQLLTITGTQVKFRK